MLKKYKWKWKRVLGQKSQPKPTLKTIDEAVLKHWPIITGSNGCPIASGNSRKTVIPPSLRVSYGPPRHTAKERPSKTKAKDNCLDPADKDYRLHVKCGIRPEFRAPICV